ncbi:MAG: hypothetical protein B5M53_07710 [Candidatus Cloacimonas sp. 4484_209]|nr:MAG: hypothetical protein B5M53_07710 [Candidatus Cloacimonas sp. 4484_209]
MRYSKQFLFATLFVLFLGFAAAGYGQQNWQDVVYLKNGSIIRGVIVEQIPNQSVKIQTADGNLFVYRIEEIKKITKEPIGGFGKSVHPGRSIEQESSLGKYELEVNPLGFLQFGPIVDFGPRIGTSSYLYGHFRWTSLGLLGRYVTSEGGEEDVSMGCMALGVGFKRLFVNDYSPNYPYAGSFFEYGWGSTSGYDYYYEEPWTGSHAYFSFLGNGGYRWNFSGFFVNLGFMGGVATETKNEWWYNNYPSYKTQDSKETFFIYMLEFSMGWSL